MIALDIAIIIVLIGINGVLALSELAVVSARTHRLSQSAEAGDKGARVALALAQEPTRFLATVQMGITLVAIVSGAFGGAALGDHVGPQLEHLGLSPSTAHTTGVVIVVALITYFSLVFGEIVPKRIALSSPEAIASLVGRPMKLLETVGAPFVAVLSVSSGFVLRLLHVHKERKETVTEEEIRLLISMSAESGSVAAEEAELLERVFHFGDHKVHEAMTPRNLAIGIEKDATIAGFYAIYQDAPHARFPVYEESLDNIVGILGIKDVLAAISRGEAGSDTPIAPLVRDCLFVPETKRVDELFREMQTAGIQMAVAVDEFGGTAGIITLEQLLEEMVGQVSDELAGRHHEVTSVDADTYEVSGALSIDEARDELGLDIPDGSYDTLAGFVLSRLGHIPMVGEAVEVGDHRIAVSEMRNLKIEMLKVTRKITSGRPA